MTHRHHRRSCMSVHVSLLSLTLISSKTGQNALQAAMRRRDNESSWKGLTYICNYVHTRPRYNRIRAIRRRVIARRALSLHGRSIDLSV